MCGIAAGGGILLSGPTHDALGGQAVVGQGREVAVKGQAEPLLVYLCISLAVGAKGRISGAGSGWRNRRFDNVATITENVATRGEWI